jgi:hypothetical protein
VKAVSEALITFDLCLTRILARPDAEINDEISWEAGVAETANFDHAFRNANGMPKGQTALFHLA